MRFAFLWGLLMAASVSQFPGPVSLLVFPDTHLRGALTRTLPDASNTTTATEADQRFVVTPGTGNLGTPNGGRGAEPVITGTAVSGLDSVVAITQGGRADATARYKVTDSAGEIFGQTPIYIPTGFETIKAVTSGDGYKNPRGVVMPDGDLVVVAERWEGTQAVTVYQRAQGVAAWTSVADPIWTTGTAFAADVRPSPQIWSMPADTTSGVALFVASLEVTATNVQTLRVDVSEDGGTNWRTAGRSNLRFDTTTIKYQLEDALWDSVGNQAVVVVRKYDSGGPTYTLLTYVSNDFGATWQQITSSLISGVRVARVAYSCGVQYLIYVDGSNDLWVRNRSAAGGAWALLNDSAALDTDAMSSNIGITILPNNAIYVYFRSASAEPATNIIGSTDGGYTWGPPASSTNGAPYWNYPMTGGSAVQYASDQSGVSLTNGIAFTDLLYYGGTVYMVGILASTDTVDNSLTALHWGSYSTLEWLDMYSFGKSYYPTQIPSTKDSTVTFTGTAYELVTTDNDDFLIDRINTTAANTTGYNSLTNVATSNGFHIILGAYTSGGSLASSALVVRVSATDTTTYYVQAEVRIDVSNLQMQVYDTNAAALVGSPVAFTSDTNYEIFIAISYTDLKVSAWWKPVTEAIWNPIAQGETVSSAGGVVGQILYGKVASSTAIMDIIFARRLAADGWADGSNDLYGIPAMTFPDGTPDGFEVAWRGGPFYAANAWQIQARGSAPLEKLSPYALNISPSDMWIGEDDAGGEGGTSYRIAYDFGASYSGVVDSNLFGIVWANMPGIVSITLSRWTGAAISSVKSVTIARSPFGAAGSVGFSRTSTSSYQIRANGTNGTPRVMGEGEYNGWWCHIQDAGGDSFAGRILRSSPGQFTTATNTLAATLEFDPDTVVDVNGGGFASVATSETAGTISLYSPDGAAIVASSTETTRYWFLTITTAPGYLEPRGGALWFGPAFAMARPVRDGASLRTATAEELRAIGGSGAMSLQTTRRRSARAVDLPYDQILSHDGYCVDGSPVNTLAFTGSSTARATIDNNLLMLRTLLESRGRRTPCALILDGQFSADPGSSTQIFTGRNVIYGIMPESLDVTAGAGGYLYPPGFDSGSQQGASLTFVEVV